MSRIKIKKRSLAILYDKDEKLTPSNPEAIRIFIDIARKLNFYVEIINVSDFHKISYFDAVFIRKTTSLNNSVHLFSKKAENLGLIVIDDAKSIQICCDKTTQYELFLENNIPIPKTFVIQDNLEATKAASNLKTPYVIKNPYGSFSTGVFLAGGMFDYQYFIGSMLNKSKKVIVQEFISTVYDWRIGILNKEIIFACKYYMTKDNWKIIKHDRNGEFVNGDSIPIPVKNLPNIVSETALKASALIGEGFYGVDIKQIDEETVYVIEINDNPNIDAGIEDALLGETLYYKIIQNFHLLLDQMAL